MVGGQDLAFLCDDLGGQLAVRVLQLLVGRNLGERPDDSQEKDYQGDRGEKEDPEPADDLLFGILCHLKNLLGAHKTIGLARLPNDKFNQKIWKIARIVRYFAK